MKMKTIGTRMFLNSSKGSAEINLTNLKGVVKNSKGEILSFGEIGSNVSLRLVCERVEELLNK